MHGVIKLELVCYPLMSARLLNRYVENEHEDKILLPSRSRSQTHGSKIGPRMIGPTPLIRAFVPPHFDLPRGEVSRPATLSSDQRKRVTEVVEPKKPIMTNGSSTSVSKLTFTLNAQLPNERLLT